jgi:hypothetical protein
VGNKATLSLELIDALNKNRANCTFHNFVSRAKVYIIYYLLLVRRKYKVGKVCNQQPCKRAWNWVAQMDGCENNPQNSVSGLYSTEIYLHKPNVISGTALSPSCISDQPLEQGPPISVHSCPQQSDDTSLVSLFSACENTSSVSFRISITGAP